MHFEIYGEGKHSSGEYERCEQYWGNVCSGFGGVTICYACGQDMMNHSPAALGFIWSRHRGEYND